jgi:hypothetical protein
MPPESMDLYGRAAMIGFFATVPAQGRLETIRLVAARANRQPGARRVRDRRRRCPDTVRLPQD